MHWNRRTLLILVGTAAIVAAIVLFKARIFGTTRIGSAATCSQIMNVPASFGQFDWMGSVDYQIYHSMHVDDYWLMGHGSPNLVQSFCTQFGLQFQYAEVDFKPAAFALEPNRWALPKGELAVANGECPGIGLVDLFFVPGDQRVLVHVISRK